MALPQGFTLKALLENPELLNPPKYPEERKVNVVKEKKVEKDESLEQILSSQSAFLGPQLWDKTIMGDNNDFKLEFMDLDDFLEETGILGEEPKVEQPRAVPQPVQRPPSPSLQSLLQQAVNPNTQLSPGSIHSDDSMSQRVKSERGVSAKVDYYREVPSSSEDTPRDTPSPEVPFSESDLALASIPEFDYSIGSEPSPDTEIAASDLALATAPGQEGFDPRKKTFTDDELRPQPMIRKSKKVFVPEDAKDDKYWARRRKNNVAAKRSRDARRIKENQIALRAAFLEKQNDKLTLEIAEVRRENEELCRRLAKYEG